MPQINARMSTIDPSYSKYEHVDSNYSKYDTRPSVVPADPISIRNASTTSNFMSITNGNSIPMRGILPIEQMSDYDLSRFYPYTAHFDRIPNYTYYQLANGR